MRSYIYNATLTLSIAAIVLPSGIRAQGLHLTPGAHLVVSGAPNLVLNNTGLTNDGHFTADSSTVLFTGNRPGTVSFIDGSKPIAFYHLTINRSSGDVLLHNNSAVTGDITMHSGNFQLNNYVLDLGTTGRILGERSSSCITGAEGGTIKVIAVLNAPQGVNPGNIGVAFTSEANLGRTMVIRGHIRQAASASGTGIQRYFDMDPENNSYAPTTLRFYYLDGELAGKNGDDLALFSRGSDGSWACQGKDRADRSAGWVAKENIGQLHRFTLAIPGGKPAIPGGKANAFQGAGIVERTVSLSVAPNPSSGAFRMILVSDREQDRVIKLYDVLGHLLQSKKVHCIAGTNTIEWYMADLAQGTYRLAADGMAPVAVAIIKN